MRKWAVIIILMNLFGTAIFTVGAELKVTGRVPVPAEGSKSKVVEWRVQVNGDWIHFKGPKGQVIDVERKEDKVLQILEWKTSIRGQVRFRVRHPQMIKCEMNNQLIPYREVLDYLDKKQVNFKGNPKTGWRIVVVKKR